MNINIKVSKYKNQYNSITVIIPTPFDFILYSLNVTNISTFHIPGTYRELIIVMVTTLY